MNRREIKMISPTSVPGSTAGCLENCSPGLRSDRTTEPEPPGVGRNTLQSVVTGSTMVTALADASSPPPSTPSVHHGEREKQHGI